MTLLVLIAALAAQPTDPRTAEEFSPIRSNLIADLTATVCPKVQRYTTAEGKIRQFEVMVEHLGLTPEEDEMLRMICSEYPRV